VTNGINHFHVGTMNYLMFENARKFM